MYRITSQASDLTFCFESTVPYLFYRAKTSNYFHLHYDMTLPLFKFFEEYTKNIPTSSVVLMPSVEITRLKVRNLLFSIHQAARFKLLRHVLFPQELFVGVTPAILCLF